MSSSNNTAILRSEGFTLVEALLAIAILSLIASMVFWSLATTVQIRDAVASEMRWDGMTKTALQVMSDELSSGFTHPLFPWMGQDGQVNGEPSDLAAFVSGRHIPTGGERVESAFARILYLRDGSRLIRVAKRNLFGDDSSSVEQLVLADSVAAFNIRYFDPLTQAWVDEWDGRGRRSLPKAILLELTVQREGEAPMTLRQWVPMLRQF
jgi:type II secretion system protein J